MRWSVRQVGGRRARAHRLRRAERRAVHLFRKRRDAVKVLFFDGSGMCVFYKRLDSGVFRVPTALAPDARHVELDEGLLDALLDGVDLGEAPKSPRHPPRVALTRAATFWLDRSARLQVERGGVSVAEPEPSQTRVQELEALVARMQSELAATSERLAGVVSERDNVRRAYRQLMEQFELLRRRISHCQSRAP